MTQNIFIVHSPYQIFIAEIVAKYIHKSPEYENVILLELNQDYKTINRDLWLKVESLENGGGSTLGRKRFLACEKNMEIIKQYANKDIETYLFISDISWPMNNRIFFDKHLRGRVKYCMISDGLGTMALQKVSRAIFIRGLAKSFNGLIHHGVRYTNYMGNQYGLDRKEIEYIYAPNVKLIECEPSKKKEVSFDAIHKLVNLDKEKCLFLDQPYWVYIQDSNWRAIREKTINFINSLNIKERYYKNHHFGRKDEEIYYESKGFNIINSNKCAEQIVAENNYGIVVSYASSALFNLKCMYHDELRCIALLSKEIRIANGYHENKSERIIEYYNAVNVEIIENL
ncbi:MAG: hypothetical protein IMZ52_04170 [Actinobacteria bacterium]|nr:hypothetical protein [Actinomycetota bacterium]